MPSPQSIAEIHLPLTLDEQPVIDMRSAFVMLAGDAGVDGICLCGSAEQFSHGVRLGFFKECLAADNIDRLLAFGRVVQSLQLLIEQSPKPVVAWVRGNCVGGGLELALACDRIVASPKSKFSLPETGLGIYPGMGGTQRTPRRIGVGLAKWMIYTGSILPAEQALAIGLIDALAPEATSAAEAFAALDLAQVSAGDRPPQMATFERLFEENTVNSLTAMPMETVSDPAVVRTLVNVRRKSATALALAERIIDGGIAMTQHDGVELEFSYLREIFSSPDAREKLLAV
jgi:enoyl-CoA hydratase/carnithine racemase